MKNPSIKIGNVTISKDSKAGKGYSFEIPAGMTGSKFKSFKSENADAIKLAISELMDSESSEEGDTNKRY
jgi:hypothetical protein